VESSSPTLAGTRLSTPPCGPTRGRDPWVFHQPSACHMLLTARANLGPPDDRGAIGHATSDDLRHWVAQPPLSVAGQSYGQLEVPKVENIEGRTVLFFSGLGNEPAVSRGSSPRGIWAATSHSLLGEWDIGHAQQLTDEPLYAGRVITDRARAWLLLAFRKRRGSAYETG
jgi:beta-fructofuranosidase